MKNPFQIIIRNIIARISVSCIESGVKKLYTGQLSNMDIEALTQGYLTAEKKLSGMDMRYIVCFLIEMNVKDIALLFNIDSSSVRTARYRIRKKFGQNNTFRLLF